MSHLSLQIYTLDIRCVLIIRNRKDTPTEHNHYQFFISIIKLRFDTFAKTELVLFIHHMQTEPADRSRR